MFGITTQKYDQKISLKSVSVVCSIRNLLVSCTSEFVYKNDDDDDAEALFSFPLDNNCVVYYMEAVIGNKRIVGICKEVEEAKSMYEAAKEMGHKAAMIEQNRSMTDVFKCRIGNFPKKSEAKIIIKFAMELQLNVARSEIKDVDRFKLALPLILKPRYTPAAYQGDREVYEVTNKYIYQFKAACSGTKVINDISSVNHKLGVNYTNDKKTCAEIHLQSEFDGTKDLDINIDYKSMREPYVLLELGTKSEKFVGKKAEGAFYESDVAMINFLPKFDPVENRKENKIEIVFVVDRSGSMGGSNIERAKECLMIFLKSLPVECKFQIYGFGDTFDKAFPTSQLYDEQSISIALTYQKRLDADFGGTELMRPLQDMYNTALSDDYSRIAFILTDGDVGNQDEVINLVKKHNKKTRLFTVGIGDGVSTSLVDKVAKAGLGKSAFVRNAAELSASVMELLDIAVNSTPFFDSQIKWNCPSHVSVIQVPKETPPIFSDYFLTMFCMIKGMQKEDVIKCTLSGKVDEKTVSFSLEIKNHDAIVDEEFRVHRLLSKYKIEEMTAEIDDGKEESKKALIELSTQVNIVTKWTTFVAIDPAAPTRGLISDSPVYMAESLRCMAPMALGARCAYSMAPMAQMADAFGGGSFGQAYDAVDGAGFADESGDLFEDCERSEMSREPMYDVDLMPTGMDLSKKMKQDVVMFLAEKQNINGSWTYIEEILKQIGLDVKLFQQNKPAGISEEIWTTAVVYQYLSTQQQVKEKEWRLFGKKAVKWIEKTLNDPKKLSTVMEAAIKIF